jgi:hypothetical protein
VFEKNAMKKDDHNHPNSLQRFSVTVLVKEKTPAMKRKQLLGENTSACG